MIPRYSRPQMVAIWSPENRYRLWFEIEALACEGMAAIGEIPAEAARTIRERGAPKLAAIGPADIERIDEIERETRHDVIAFLTWLAESVGPDSRFVHQGLTSSDVLDTCLSLQLVQSADLLLADLDAVLAALKGRAFEHKYTPTIGRSHGIHAEPTSFGLKLAGSASMPSRPVSASSWPAITPSSTAAARACAPPARKSPPARFPAPSALSPMSIRALRNMSPNAWV